ncbi:Max dimerization protein 3 [Tupaia chinensis]|uniref:Max dimerization protein 3 n=1 Tax=Tupaia chinensis TaxID=246437 RepID=L9JCC3_TUPCH|nr:Max dimerization protein 3 [Tupaia chinensis]
MVLVFGDRAEPAGLVWSQPDAGGDSLAEAEHGYASLCPHRIPGPVHRRRKRPRQAAGALDSGRSVHNELEKRRRAQLKRCLEELKQQVPPGTDCARFTTLSLLRRARTHIQKRRSGRQSLQQRLEQLRGLAGASERERPRADSLDSSGLSSERSDSDQEELEVDVESLVFGGPAELLRGFSAGREHSYSHGSGTWERSDSDQEELEVDVESLVFGGPAELLRGFSAGREHSYSHGSGTWL